MGDHCEIRHPIHSNSRQTSKEAQEQEQEQEQSAVEEAMTLDDALELIPLGPFHYRMLFLCGLAFMSDALEVNLLSFLSACASADFNLSTTEEASVSSVVFAGIMIGAYFFGMFANRYGRKMAFLLACVIISTGGFVTAAAPSFAWLLVIRLVVGFGIGGAGIAFDLLAEFMPVSQRGVFLICIEFFWTFGSMYVNGVAWATLDSSGWRGLALYTAIPVAVVSLLCVCYLPESPRWLLACGRREEAEAILHAAARVNKSFLPPIRLLQDPHETREEVEKASYWELVSTPQARRLSLPLWSVWMLFGFTYYGIILFSTRLFEGSGSDDDGDDNQCSFDYAALFESAASELAGCALGAILLDYLGRSRMQTIFYFIAGVAAVGMGLLRSNTSLLMVLSVAGRMAVMCASNATWVATPELYSTELRTLGHSVSTCLSKVGSFVAPYVVLSPLSAASVGILLGVANCCASFAAYLLPETTGATLGHTSGAAGHFAIPRDSDEEEETEDKIQARLLTISQSSYNQ